MLLYYWIPLSACLWKYLLYTGCALQRRRACLSALDMYRLGPWLLLNECLTFSLSLSIYIYIYRRCQQPVVLKKRRGRRICCWWHGIFGPARHRKKMAFAACVRAYVHGSKLLPRVPLCATQTIGRGGTLLRWTARERSRKRELLGSAPPSRGMAIRHTWRIPKFLRGNPYLVRFAAAAAAAAPGFGMILHMHNMWKQSRTNTGIAQYTYILYSMIERAEPKSMGGLPVSSLLFRTERGRRPGCHMVTLFQARSEMELQLCWCTFPSLYMYTGSRRSWVGRSPACCWVACSCGTRSSVPSAGNRWLKFQLPSCLFWGGDRCIWLERNSRTFNNVSARIGVAPVS
jgi:hypothetical protein